MADRTELRKLAEAAKALPNNYAVGDDFSDAASPDVVLGLLDEIGRLREDMAKYLRSDAAWYIAERDQLRAVLEAIANHNPAVTHGWAEHVREMARRALADPEVEKLL